MDLLKAFIGAGFEKDLFNKEQLSLDRCKEVIDYYKEHGNYPSHGSKDINIKALAKWLTTARRAKENKGYNKWYPSVEVMAIEAGLPNMFNKIDREQIAIDNCQEVIDYHKEHGKYPSYTSKDIKIKLMGIWLLNMKGNKRSIRDTSRRGIFYPSVEVMAIEAGLPDMFNSLDKEQLALDKCQEVIDYYKENGKYPSSKSKNKTIRLLGSWITKIRGANQERGTNTFYLSFETMTEKAGLPNMFNLNWRDDLK